MATREFAQEGSTSGQRITAAGATTPNQGEPGGRPRLEAAADRFATRMLRANPEISELVRTARGGQAPEQTGSRFDDLSESEAAEALRMLATKRGDLDPGTASMVSQFLAEHDF